MKQQHHVFVFQVLYNGVGLQKHEHTDGAQVYIDRISLLLYAL